MSRNPNEGPTGLLAALRAEVVARIATDECFAAPNAVSVQDGGLASIEKSVNEALERRTSGMCLNVTVPRMAAGDMSPQHVVATVSVMIYERPTINWSEKGRRLAIEDAAEAVFRRLAYDDDGTPGWGPATWARFVFSGFRVVLTGPDQVGTEVIFTTETVLKSSVS